MCDQSKLFKKILSKMVLQEKQIVSRGSKRNQSLSVIPLMSIFSLIFILISFFELCSNRLLAQPQNQLQNQSMEQLKLAQSLIIEGKRASDAGEYQLAIEKYKQAHRIIPSPDQLYTIATLMERIEGGCKAAIEAWEDFSNSCSDCIYRVKGLKKYDVLKKNCSIEISINSEPKGAEVYLDGKQMGITPLYKTIIAGKYDLQLKKNGFLDYSEELIFLKGEINKNKTFNLESATPLEVENPEIEEAKNRKNKTYSDLHALGLIFGFGTLNEKNDDSIGDRSRINAGFIFNKDIEKPTSSIVGFGLMLDYLLDQYDRNSPKSELQNNVVENKDKNEQNTMQTAFWLKFKFFEHHSFELGTSLKYLKIANQNRLFEKQNTNASIIEKKSETQRTAFFAVPVFKLSLRLVKGLLLDLGNGKPFHPTRDQGFFASIKYAFGVKPNLSKTWIQLGMAQTIPNAGTLLNGFVDEFMGASYFYPFLGFSVRVTDEFAVESNIQFKPNLETLNAMVQISYLF